MEFEEKVLETLTKIPEGKVVTYKMIAEAIGKPKAYRAVGNAVGKNPNPIEVPCHRVIKSSGEVGNYGGGKEKKKKLLEKEGVEIKNGKIDLDKYAPDLEVLKK